MVTGKNAGIFNVTGVSPLTKAAGGVLFKSTSKITAIIMTTDPINMAQIFFTFSSTANEKKEDPYSRDLSSILNGHSLDNIFAYYEYK